MVALASLPSAVVSGSLAGSAAGGGAGGDGREPDDEPSATAVAGAVSPQPPAVGLHDRPADGQPEPAPAAVAGAGCIDPEEALEHPLQQLWRDPLATVGHRQLHLVAILVGADLHPAARRRVAQGVAEQVAQYLAQAVGVDAD